MNRLRGCLTFGAILVSALGCDTPGGDSSVNDSAFFAPVYDASQLLPTTFERDLSQYTSRVTANQSQGALLAGLLEDQILIDDDTVVQLVEISKNTVPESLDDGGIAGASELGIGNNALVVDTLSELHVRNQGDRGTCVAFALNAAAEVLLRRQSVQGPDLSEQNTYFMAKKQTNGWDVSGLSPSITFDDFANGEIPLVAEQFWPYNPADRDCSDYLAQYPGFFCSQTEAQGGGDDARQQEPEAAAADGFVITEAHQLYASVNRVRQALYRGYPVVLSVNANTDFQLASFKQGVVSWVLQASPSGIAGHAVLAVGYQDDPDVDGGGYVIVQNSWSDTWGDHGFAYVTYEWLQHSILDAQAVVRL